MAKLADLKKTCDVLHLHPIPTKNSINKVTGEREKTLSIADCTHAIQQFYLEQRKQNGTYRKSIEYILAMDSPMLALLIKHKKKEDQDAIWDNNNKDWLWEEKLDGCFNYDTMITLSDGSTEKIGKIVENKMQVSVKSYNTVTGEVESKKITNWFDNGIKDNFKKIKGPENKSISATDNHKFYTGDGKYIDAKDMHIGYKLVNYRDKAFQALLGSLLGDTTIGRDARYDSLSTAVRCNHSIKQSKYLEYKCSIFDMDWKNRTNYISGYGTECISVTSKCNSTFNEAYDLRYNMFEDNPREYYRKMGIIGLAFLFMDDGSNSGGQLSLHINSFSQNQAKELYNYINNDIGLQCTLTEEYGYPQIHFTQVPSRAFSSMISNYVHPDVRYKLAKEFRNDYFYDISNDIKKPHISKVRCYIPDDRVYFSDKAYDIEVEDNHNYFANGMLVHNCRSLLCYDPQTGFDMYSRNLSVTDQLPINYGEKILWPEMDLSKLTIPFIIDCEILPKNKEIDKTGDMVPVADTQLNLISSILSLNEEDSKKVQERNPVKFVAFDILYLNNEPQFDIPLWKRKQMLSTLLKFLKEAGVPVEEVPTKPEGQDKLDFYNSIINSGGEGVVVKDLNSKYDISGRRAGEWCLSGNTMITLADGSKESIKNIVENKMKVNVLSYNEISGVIESKPIVNWFNNGKKDDWVGIRVYNKRDSSKNSNKIVHNTVKCTSKHKFYRNEYIEAQNVQVGDKLLCRDYIINNEQKQVLLGLLLGDGHFNLENNGNNVFGFSQSYKNIEFYEYIKSIFINVINAEDDSVSGFGSNVKSFRTFKFQSMIDFINEYSYNGVRNYDKILSDIDEIGIAIWFQSDGYFNGDDRFAIATGNIPADKLYMWKEKMSNKYNTKNTGTVDSTSMRFGTDLSRIMFNNIINYIHPSMLHKCKNYNQSEFIKIKPITVGSYMIPVTIKKDYFNDTDVAYDIEVKDNHNYFANDILVHNCKIKRSVSQAMSAEGLGDTIDAFVIGFEEGEPGTKNEGKVASLKFGVELLDQFNEPILDQSGDPITHHIATVGGLTDELKDAITTKDIFGNVALKQEVYGRVASIDGQDLSSRNLRFAHAVLVCWRVDRSANTCKLRKDILEKLVL